MSEAGWFFQTRTEACCVRKGWQHSAKPPTKSITVDKSILVKSILVKLGAVNSSVIRNLKLVDCTPPRSRSVAPPWMNSLYALHWTLDWVVEGEGRGELRIRNNGSLSYPSLPLLCCITNWGRHPSKVARSIHVIHPGFVFILITSRYHMYAVSSQNCSGRVGERPRLKVVLFVLVKVWGSVQTVQIYWQTCFLIFRVSANYLLFVQNPARRLLRPTPYWVSPMSLQIPATGGPLNYRS